MEKKSSKFEILKEEVSKMVEKTAKASLNNKLKSFRIYIGIAISSAIITFLVAIGNDIPKEGALTIKIIILLFSGLSTILAAWDGFYNHKQLWINYGETRNQLSALELKLKLLDEEEKTDDKKIDKIFEEYQEILSNGNNKWTKMRLEVKESNNHKGA